MDMLQGILSDQDQIIRKLEIDQKELLSRTSSTSTLNELQPEVLNIYKVLGLPEPKWGEKDEKLEKLK